jgi:hypothetical protein
MPDLPDDPVDDLYPGVGLPEGGTLPKLVRHAPPVKTHDGIVPRRMLPKSQTELPPPKPTVTIAKFRSVVKNTLRGFCDVSLPIGPLVLKILDVSVHQKNGKRWIGLPVKPSISADGQAQKDQHGKIRYTPVLEWGSKEAADRFAAKVIELIDQKYPGALE